LSKRRNVDKLLPFLERFDSGYYFYRDGRVWRTKRTNGNKQEIPLEFPVIASKPMSRGYRRVHMSRNCVYEHTLIYAHVHGLEALMLTECIDHINGDKSDNRIENLEGVTFAENCARAEKMGLVRRTYGELNGCSKLTSLQVDAIREQYKSGINQYALAGLFGISQGSVSEIVNYKKRKFG